MTTIKTLGYRALTLPLGSAPHWGRAITRYVNRRALPSPEGVGLSLHVRNARNARNAANAAEGR